MSYPRVKRLDKTDIVRFGPNSMCRPTIGDAGLTAVRIEIQNG